MLYLPLNPVGTILNDEFQSMKGRAAAKFPPGFSDISDLSFVESLLHHIEEWSGY